MKYAELIEEGWIDIKISSCGYLILKKGDERILFDKEKDEVHLRYKDTRHVVVSEVLA